MAGSEQPVHSGVAKDEPKVYYRELLSEKAHYGVKVEGVESVDQIELKNGSGFVSSKLFGEVACQTKESFGTGLGHNSNL